MKRKTIGFLLLFGIFWSAITLLFDKLIFVAAARQILSRNYPATQGTILSSEVTHHDDNDGGTTHGVSIRYSYSVGGEEYTGTKYRYASFNSSDSTWAHSVVSANAPGE